MTQAEYKALQCGSRIRHINTGEVSVIDSNETKHGYFHRPENSKGGWNTINPTNCKYYETL